MRTRLLLARLLLVVAAAAAGGAARLARAEDVPMTSAQILQQAAEAASGGRHKEALLLAGRAIEADSSNAGAWLLRGKLYESLRRHAAAVADFTRAIELDPRLAEAYDRRGSEQFKLGRIEESIADFDRYIELVPEQEPYHWKRGISYYYAGRFAAGRKQFEGYQTVDDNDVENAVWRYLCMAREFGVEEARRSLLSIKDDRRVPMMEIYDLYRGEKTPADVLAAARAGAAGDAELNQRMFYALLYLGLYYEAAGEADKALEHIQRAADEHPIGHYMWDVARVHKERLEQARDER